MSNSVLHEDNISYEWWEQNEDRLDQVEVSDNVADLKSEHQCLLYFIKHYYPQILMLNEEAALHFRDSAFSIVLDDVALGDALCLCLETDFALPDEFLNVLEKHYYDTIGLIKAIREIQRQAA